MAAPLKILLGNAIKRTRFARGMSQEQLAVRAGLHRTYVSDLERGARNPSLESVQKLAQALELSLPALLQGAQKDRDLVEILLVEDDPRDIELTVRAFKTARITNPVHIAHDGAEATDFLFATGRYTHRKEVPLPEVILLDLNLPKKSGIEVLREIRADERTRAIPVIILTVSDRDRDITQCRRLGAEIYIVKPVRFESFSKVASHLNLAWALVKPISAPDPLAGTPGEPQTAVRGIT